MQRDEAVADANKVLNLVIGHLALNEHDAVSNALDLLLQMPQCFRVAPGVIDLENKLDRGQRASQNDTAEHVDDRVGIFSRRMRGGIPEEEHHESVLWNFEIAAPKIARDAGLAGPGHVVDRNLDCR